MEAETCALCGSKFDLDSFNRHLRSHKTTVANYYETCYPRKDRFDGQKIEFKNREQYFSADFNSKTNLQAWLKAQTDGTARQYLTRLLKARQEAKGLVYAPTQVELRTLVSPSIIYYNTFFGNYYDLAASLGMKNKHNLIKPTFIAAKPKIQVDTREKLPLKFNQPFLHEKLDFGDYKFSAKGKEIVFERKSLIDFIGTLSVGLERFVKEIKRADYMIVIVETKLESALAFNQLPYVQRYTKLQPAYIFHNVRALLQEHPNIQFLFVDGRVKCAEMMYKIFNIKEDYKRMDLQFLHDSKQL